MFKKQEIINDFKTLLASLVMDGNSVPVYQDGEDLEDSAEYPAVAVSAPFKNPAFLSNSGLSSGFEAVSVQLDCITFRKDDKKREKVNELAALVLTCLEDKNILENLNQVSNYYLYIGLNPGDNFDDDEDSLRHEVLQINIKTANR